MVQYHTKVKIEDLITAQLRPGTRESPTMLDKATSLLADSGMDPAAAGRLGGFVGKAWRRWLVTVLTDYALRESDAETLATRERVRDWQRATFGQALSSRHLTRYAQSLGYRGEDLMISPAISGRCSSTFKKYRDALRIRVRRI
jgi:hypothetical protein